ncbi:MAG: hypothetical protein QN163_01205 [Armatimonadota bacterium]|nr:hypothetical protein [Armatimonadota bacterium]MDR5696498.1 hypothetical protein [Armatimonadota bacterium]
MGTATRTRLGEILVQTGLITRAQLDEAIAAHKQSGIRLGAALLQLGHASEDDIAWALSTQLQVPYVHLSPELVDPAAVERVPVHAARRLGLCPVIATTDEITVAMVDPTDEAAVAEVERISGLRVATAIALASDIETTLAALQSRTGSPEVALGAPALRFHLSAAAAAGAEEIYFEPLAAGIRVRYRTPGGLVASHGPSLEPGTLDEIARAPQPVRVQIPLPGHWLDVNLRAAATPHGTAVFGTLSGGSFGDLLPEGVLDRLCETIRKPGVLIVGSPEPALRRGILRALAASADSPRTLVVVAGAPGATAIGNAVEVQTPDPDLVAHTRAEFVSADTGADLDLAALLIAARHPGQVLVVGTPHLRAAWALEDLAARAGRLHLQAALTGVLCTVRVPALCRCATEHRQPPPGWPGQPPARWGAPAGCDDCRQTGYDGYAVLHEWYPAGPELQRALLEPSPFALAERIRSTLAPALADGAREAVQRLRTTPKAVWDLLEA